MRQHVLSMNCFTEMNDVEFNTHEMLSSGHFTLNMIEPQLNTGD